MTEHDQDHPYYNYEQERDITVFTKDEVDQISLIFKHELHRLLIRGDEYFVGGNLSDLIPSYAITRDLHDQIFIIRAQIHNLIASTDATRVERIKLWLRRLLHL